MPNTHATISDARSAANRLDAAVVIYAVLGFLGSVVLMATGDGFVVGAVGMLATALTAGCAWALVHGLRLLAVIAERDLPPEANVAPERRVPSRMDSTPFLIALTVGVAIILAVIVIAALALG